MAATLFPASCQYIGSQVARSQNQYNWFFFHTRLSSTPSHRESPLFGATQRDGFCQGRVRGGNSGGAGACPATAATTTTAAAATPSRAPPPTWQGSSPPWPQVRTSLKTPSKQITPFPVLGAQRSRAEILNLHGPPQSSSRPLLAISTWSCLSRQQRRLVSPTPCGPQPSSGQKPHQWPPVGRLLLARQRAACAETLARAHKPRLTRMLPPAWLSHLPT